MKKAYLFRWRRKPSGEAADEKEATCTRGRRCTLTKRNPMSWAAEAFGSCRRSWGKRVVVTVPLTCGAKSCGKFGGIPLAAFHCRWSLRCTEFDERHSPRDWIFETYDALPLRQREIPLVFLLFTAFTERVASVKKEPENKIGDCVPEDCACHEVYDAKSA